MITPDSPNPISEWYFKEHELPYQDTDPNRLALGLIKPNSKVLSCGCGAGREVAFLKSIDCEIIANDISTRMRDLSQSKFPDVEHHVGNVLEFLPRLEKNQFDYILFLFNGINYLEKKEFRKIFCQRCYELLKPNGKLILTTSHRFSSICSAINSRKKPKFFYSPFEINDWFAGLNFYIRKTKINGTSLIVAKK